MATSSFEKVERFIVRVGSNKDDLSGNRYKIHTWDVKSNSLSPVLWESERIFFHTGRQLEMYEKPVEFIADDHKIYLGLNTGAVHSIDMLSEKENILTYPSPFADRTSLRGRVAMESDEDIIRGAREVRGIVKFKGNIYSANDSGVQKLKGEAERIPTYERVDERRSSSLVEWNGRLCTVPLPFELTPESFNSTKTGSLVDVFSKEVIFEKFTPFDGSGMKQADYIICGDRLYLSHGNHPDQKITVKGFPDGKEIKKIPVLDSWNFIAHEGKVYDIRNLGHNGCSLRLSDEDNDKKPIFSPPSGKIISSVSSAGKDGLMAVLYDRKSSSSKIVNALDSSRTLLEVDGVAQISPVRYEFHQRKEELI